MPHAMTDAFPVEESTAERLAPLPSLLHGGNAPQAGGGCHSGTAQQCACEPIEGASPAT